MDIFAVEFRKFPISSQHSTSFLNILNLIIIRQPLRNLQNYDHFARIGMCWLYFCIILNEQNDCFEMVDITKKTSFFALYFIVFFRKT